MSAKLFVLVFLAAAVRSDSQAPPSIDQVLRENGVDTSRQSLIENLHNKDIQVRGLAAMQLAVEDDKSALPYLREALKAEKAGPAQLNMARALKTLGDKGGTEAMIRICVNSATAADIRLMAAQEIPPGESSKCIEAIINHLAVTDNPVEMYGVLLFLANKVDTILTPSDEMEQLTQALSREVASTVPGIRQEAAVCIGRFKVVTLKAKLQEVEAKENNAEAKRAMRTAGEILR